jgi:hypothetical protein
MGQMKVRYGMFPQGLYNINHMPMPEHIGPDRYDHKRFLACAETKLTWSLWPRRCHVSGRWLWFSQAYRAMYVITSPGDPAIWTRWYSRGEMLILKLKGY